MSPLVVWRFLLAGIIGLLLAVASAQSPPLSASLTEELPILTQVLQIRQLPSERSARGYPVRLQGVVVYHNHPKTLFVHDATGGIYVVENSGVNDSLQTGQKVEVFGVTNPGEFAPEIRARRIDVLGFASLPEPRVISFEQLADGTEDSQWVELRGIVRSVRVYEGTGLPEFRIATGGGEVRTEIYDRPPAHLENFVDATVRVRGAVGGIFNQKRQLVAPKLFVPGLTNVFVEVPAPPDSFDVPVSPIASLLRYSAQGGYGHRVKVRGRVTYQQIGQTLFIRDETQGLSIQTRQRQVLQRGDIVEAIGFPALGEWMPVLQDAEFRKLGSGESPLPKTISAAQALEGEFDTDLVACEARLLEKVRRGGSEVLVMQADNLIFNALLGAGENQLQFLRDGSELRLTGICLVHVSGPSKRRQSFEILLSSRDDIAVMKNPPLWTLARVLWALGLITAILVLAIAWLVVLKRRVGVQTEIIRQKVQREAALEERTRIAREFHDTLEQELAGIGLQLNAVELQLMDRPKQALRDLKLVKQLIQRSLVEARRSVWDLRSRVSGSGDLLATLEEVAKPLNQGKKLKISIHHAGAPHRLPGVIENNLLRIGQEAITNAVRHARAQNLKIEVRYEAGNVSLHIRDDGAGFEIAGAPSPEEGHFGLLGMRERAEKLRGKFSIQSHPGSGTEIIVEIPLNSKANRVQISDRA